MRQGDRIQEMYSGVEGTVLSCDQHGAMILFDNGHQWLVRGGNFKLYKVIGMREDEINKYLDKCGTVCYTCGRKDVSRDEMILQKSLVQLDNPPPWAEGWYNKYYMVCKECGSDKELI